MLPVNLHNVIIQFDDRKKTDSSSVYIYIPRNMRLSRQLFIHPFVCLSVCPFIYNLSGEKLYVYILSHIYMVLTWQSCKLLLYKLASSYVQRFVTNYAGFRHTHTYIFLYIKACKYSVYMYVCKYISETMNVRTMLFTFEYYNDALTFWRNRENLKILFFVFFYCESFSTN